MQLVRRIDSIEDEGTRQQALEYLADGDTATRTRLLRDFDDDALENFFPGRCGAGSVSALAPAASVGAGQHDRFYSVAALQPTGGCLEDPEQFRDDVKAAFEANGDVKSGDAASVVKKVGSFESDAKRARAREMLRDAGGEGAAQLLADASRDNLDDILSMTIDADGADSDLARQVREQLAKEYSREHLRTDRYGGDLYPEAEDGTDVAAGISRDIDYLDDSDQVTGLADAIDQTGGPQLVDLSAGGENSFKGAALEVRSTRELIENNQLDGDSIEMNYEPTWNKERLRKNLDTSGDKNDIQDIAEAVYGSKSEENVRTVKLTLGFGEFNDRNVGQAEFDGIQRTESGGIVTYHESKNFGNYRKYSDEIASDIRQNVVRLYADRVADGKDVEDIDIDVSVYTRNKNGADELSEELGNSWIKSIEGVEEIGTHE